MTGHARPHNGVQLEKARGTGPSPDNIAAPTHAFRKAPRYQGEWQRDPRWPHSGYRQAHSPCRARQGDRDTAEGHGRTTAQRGLESCGAGSACAANCPRLSTISVGRAAERFAMRTVPGRDELRSCRAALSVQEGGELGGGEGRARHKVAVEGFTVL